MMEELNSISISFLGVEHFCFIFLLEMFQSFQHKLNRYPIKDLSLCLVSSCDSYYLFNGPDPSCVLHLLLRDHTHL